MHYDVFLSHSAKDKAVVRLLAERLRADRLKVWPVPPERPCEGGFDEWVVKSGDSIPAKINPPSLRSYGGIEEGQEHSRVLACPAIAAGRRGMLCMSANAVGSEWAQLPTHPQPSTFNSQPVCALLNKERSQLMRKGRREDGEADHLRGRAVRCGERVELAEKGAERYLKDSSPARSGLGVVMGG